MAAVNFPDPSASPWTNPDNGVTYSYNSGVWKAVTSQIDIDGVTHPLHVGSTEPVANQEGELWSDTSGCPVELKVYSTCNDPAGAWEGISSSGGSAINVPDVPPTDISFNPPVSGGGTELDPFIMSPGELNWGEDTLTSEFITITGQKPGSLIIFRDLNDSINGERFRQPAAFADENGEWVGKLHFNDNPTSHQNELYAGYLRIGANGASFKWDVTAKAPGDIVTPHVTSLEFTGTGTVTHILTDSISSSSLDRITVSGNTNLDKFEAGDVIHMTDGTQNPDGSYQETYYTPLTAEVQSISEGTNYTDGGSTIATIGAVNQSVTNNGLGVLFDGEDASYLSCDYYYSQNSSPCQVYTTITYPEALNLVSQTGQISWKSLTSAIYNNTGPRLVNVLTVTYSDNSTTPVVVTEDEASGICSGQIDAGKIITKMSFNSRSLTASGKPWHRFYWIAIDGVRMIDEATVLHFTNTTDVEYFIGGDPVEDTANSITGASCVGNNKAAGEIIVRGGHWRAANGQTYGTSPGPNVSTVGGPAKTGTGTVATVEADGFTITGGNNAWIGTNTAGTNFFVTGPDFFDAPLNTADVELESTPFTTDPERVDSLANIIWEIHEDGGPVDLVDAGHTNPYHPKNLNTNSTYHVKVKHVGVALGDSEWSDSITFNTGNT